VRVARPQVAFACFVTGCLLVLLVEAAIARIAGVPLMFTGIALGVAAIATPEFLAGAAGTSGEHPDPGPSTPPAQPDQER
jgi:hypothetical protein